MNANLKKAMYWLNIISKFASVQLMIQAINVISGILIIRKMNKEDYALFTVAFAFLSTINVLADMGIGTSVSALGGVLWKDNYKFGQLINTAISLRRNMAVISALIIVPMMLWMLNKNGASFVSATIIVVLTLFSLYFQLSNSILIVTLRLHSQIDQIQRLEITTAIFKLALIIITYYTFINTFILISIFAMTTILENHFLLKWSEMYIAKDAPKSNEYKNFTITNIKKTLPNTIFFCLQGQINLFLISIFGNASKLAEVGALSKISIVFLLLQSIMTTIVLPSFSRCQSYKILVRKYFLINILFILIEIIILGICLMLPKQMLAILGNQYSNLNEELILMIIQTLFSAYVGLISSLNLAKAWLDFVWVEIPLRLIVQAFLLRVLDISTVKGVLQLNIISNFSPLIVNLLLAYRGFNEYRRAQSSIEVCK